MREIKFRMWNSCGDKSRFLYSFQALECMNQQQLGIYNHEKDGCAFEQYTGLKDKNGKEIYEGDILSRTINPRNGKPYNIIETVEYCNFVDDEYNYHVSGFNLSAYSEEFEIIGNIHENSELINA
jgi:uncharacterized phage protein (TIGR01671 family)